MIKKAGQVSKAQRPEQDVVLLDGGSVRRADGLCNPGETEELRRDGSLERIQGK